MDEPNSEGFVVFYPEENVRMKIKFPEYVRLHKLVTGINEIAIWEHRRDGKTLDDLIEKVPDEFYQWVTDTSSKLKGAYDVIHDQAQHDFSDIMAGDIPKDRKTLALRFQAKQNPNILFAILDGKPVAPIIWKLVRPHGGRVFKADIDV